MSIKISKTIDDNSIRHSNGQQSIEAIIGDIASAIKEPIKHKCKNVRQYMQAFILDFIRSISNFEFFHSAFNKFRIRITTLEIYKASNPDFNRNKYTKFSAYSADLY